MDGSVLSPENFICGTILLRIHLTTSQETGKKTVPFETERLGGDQEMLRNHRGKAVRMRAVGNTSKTADAYLFPYYH